MPPQPPPDNAKALEYALDIRKFEIDLYWKRAKYFWTLLLVAFGGYFALWKAAVDSDDAINQTFVVGIACLGFLISLAWFLVNRGSKYWQENWEAHVDRLEGGVVGALYRWPLPRHQFSWIDPTDGFPYSVSRINQIISLAVTWVWLGLLIISLLPRPALAFIACGLPWVAATATAGIALCLLTTFGRGVRKVHDPFTG